MKVKFSAKCAEVSFFFIQKDSTRPFLQTWGKLPLKFFEVVPLMPVIFNMLAKFLAKVRKVVTSLLQKKCYCFALHFYLNSSFETNSFQKFR